MKKRNNAVYKGQSTRVSTGTGDRDLVSHFYKRLNALLHPNDEIEIIPPAQVNPTHSLQGQKLIMTDYCVRKILPEVVSMYVWGAKVAPRLRALKPIADRVGDGDTPYYAGNAPYYAAAAAAQDAAADDYRVGGGDAPYYAAAAAKDITATAYNGPAARGAASCVYYALIATIERDDEAAYNRIIDLTNEMLESL